MKSSFKKVDKAGGSSQKAHFGHPDLDAVFSNSLTKGHLMVLEEDHPTTYYLSLLRYYISSNYHKNIPCIIYDSTPQKWKHLICPIKKREKVEEKKTETNQSQIAWRYDKMSINLNELVLSEEIDFLDLSKEVENVKEGIILAQEYRSGGLENFYHQIQEDFINSMESEKDTKNKKILLASLPSYIYNSEGFVDFLRALRCLARTSHATTLITVPSIISDQVRNKLLLYSDYYLQINKVGKGYTDFHASLTILKQIQVGQIKSKYRGVSIWGIKNKKKEIRIQSLYEQAVEDDDVPLNTGQGQEKKEKEGIDF